MPDIDRVRTLLQNAAADPVRSTAFAREALSALDAANLGALDKPRRRVETIADVEIGQIITVPNITSINAGATLDGIRVDWPGGDGWVRTMFAGTLDGATATLSGVSLRISINGEREIITDGNAAAYAPLLMFQPSNRNWVRLKDLRVTASQKWILSFKNNTAGAVTPWVAFGYARDV